MVGVGYLDYYIPRDKVHVKDLSLDNSFKTKEEFLEFCNTILSVEEVSVMVKEEHEVVSELLKKLFYTQLSPDSIDVLICVNETDEINNTNFHYQLKHEFKISNAYVLNISGNYCANLDVVIKLAQDLLLANSHYNNILIIGSFRRDNNKRVFGSYAVLGDGAGILVVNRNPIIQIIHNKVVTNSNLYNMNIKNDDTLLHFKGLSICLKQLLIENCISNDEIDKIIIQNTNPLLVKNALLINKFDNKKIFMNNMKHGHIAFLDFLINLKDLRELYKGITVLSISIGFRGSYVSSLIKIN